MRDGQQCHTYLYVTQHPVKLQPHLTISHKLERVLAHTVCYKCI